MMLTTALLFLVLQMPPPLQQEAAIHTATVTELEVYVEAIKVLHAGGVDDIFLPPEIRLLSRTVNISTAKYTRLETVPSEYRDAFSMLQNRMEQASEIDISELSFAGLSLMDSLRIESGWCSVGVSAVGFDRSAQTAVFYIISGCLDVDGGFNGRMIMCLHRDENRWIASDFALLDQQWKDR